MVRRRQTAILFQGWKAAVLGKWRPFRWRERNAALRLRQASVATGKGFFRLPAAQAVHQEFDWPSQGVGGGLQDRRRDDLQFRLRRRSNGNGFAWQRVLP